MGYDMHTVTKDPGEDEAVAEIQTRLRAAWQEKRQADADQISKELDAAYRSYFRLNIWGMGRARELMHAAGMLDLNSGHGDFPSPKDFGVTDEMWNDWDGESNDKTAPELRAYNEAVQAITDGQREEPAGIPVYKLGSNDGWLVTPDEIASALERYVLGDGVPADVPPWWADWIGWLKYAQEHGGFRVH